MIHSRDVDLSTMRDSQQLEHTFRCGHTRRCTVKKAREDPALCWPCRQAEDEQRRADPAHRAAKQAAYREQVARLGPRPKLSPEQRRAQRRLLGIIRTSAVLDGEVLTIWRPADEAFGLTAATAVEVHDMLRVLDISARTSAARGRHPRGGPVRRWDLLHVDPDSWGQLVRVLPSLADALGRAPGLPQVTRPDDSLTPTTSS